MELIIYLIYVVQILIINICILHYFIYEDWSSIECLSLFIFWPLYLIKAILKAFILVFKK
jgi:hypothetical protein